MKALGSFLLASGIFGLSASASAQDYPFEEWGSLWQSTCGTLDAAYAVIEDPNAHGWSDADADTDVSANGFTVIEWPEGAEGSGRIKKTAGSIPQNHPVVALLLGGLVLKTQYVFSEKSE